MNRRGAAIAACVLFACSGEDAPPTPCDTASFTEALRLAFPGDTVRPGACRIEGTFEVPNGVTVIGNQTTIVAPHLQPALTMLSGAMLTDLSIESDGPIAVLASHPGHVELLRVHIRATRGVGAGFENLANLTLEDVDLTGPVDASNASTFPSNVSSMDTATHGLVLVHIGHAQLRNVTVNGFASFGALAVESVFTWTEGNASRNLGVGMFVDGGDASLNNFAASETFKGFRLEPAYNLAAANGAVLESNSLDVSSSEGYGLLLDGSSGRQLELTANDNAEAGVWVQHATSLELSGAFARNHLGGVISFQSDDLYVHDATIDDTIDALTIVNFTNVEVGDGMHIVSSGQAMHRFTNVVLSGNQRSGVLLDLGGGALEVDAFESLDVTATASTAYGVIVQNGTAPQGWDTNVVRHDHAPMNDAAFTGTLGTVQGVGPCYMPAADLRTNGLSALLGF